MFDKLQAAKTLVLHMTALNYGETYLEIFDEVCGIPTRSIEQHFVPAWSYSVVKTRILSNL